MPCIDYDLTDEHLLVDPRLKICIECGQSKVEYHEFGISCESCGTLLIFSPLKSKTKICGIET